MAMAEKMVEYIPPENTTYVWFSQFDTKDYPFHDATGLMILIVFAYLWFILKVGPDLMKNRQPMELRKTIFVYNLLQVILSTYYTCLGTAILWETELFPKVCPTFDPKFRGKISYLIYVFLLGKYTELLDTIFFVLRKKYDQVSFLHVYHHSSVVFGTYMLFRYSQCHSCVYFITVNSFVHIVMYTYYLVSGLGPQFAKYLTWKKHITNLQRIQFISIFLHQILCILRTKCEYSYAAIIYILYSTVLFFRMFTNFYTKSYKKKKPPKLIKGVLTMNEEEEKEQ
ncbi:unnamed protein product [Chilo suppressalis]|uniref:Elongation of very long chain fatty acids protein n=1 Tax=Chilo suppressalis TaxID=168631 RepID=A0ABN8BGJ0_CHISP|nr:hypothetical protein evm_008772 [Chilo suppressalis]CAH0407562.1 unnamed protein product [Chilo suppressalis]